jgi:hypothetical protein
MGDDIKSARRFYVYLLFDFLGRPRYVGKGTGNRWLQHERRAAARNIHKNRIVAKTTRVLGEVPKIKVQENLTEPEAFALEVALIKAIGRYPVGPLCNMTDGGDGLEALPPEKLTERSRKGWASVSPQQRSEMGRKLNAGMPAEQRSEMGRKLNAALSSQQRSANAIKANAARSPEQRTEIARKAQAARPPAQRRATAFKGWETRRRRAALANNPASFETAPQAVASAAAYYPPPALVSVAAPSRPTTRRAAMTNELRQSG